MLSEKYAAGVTPDVRREIRVGQVSQRRMNDGYL